MRLACPAANMIDRDGAAWEHEWINSRPVLMQSRSAYLSAVARTMGLVIDCSTE